MASTPTSAESIAELTRRFDRLERQHTRLKRGFVLLLLVAGFGAAAAGAMQKKPRVVDADTFILRDAEGKPRGQWTMGSDGPLLSLIDAGGKARVILSVSKLGSGMTLNDSTGNPRASQAVLQDGTFELAVSGPKSQPRGQWRVGNDGSRFGLLAPDGQRVVWLMADNTMSGLACYDTPQRKRVMLAANESGPALGLHDAEGKVREILSVFDDSGPDLRLLDAEGQAIFAQPQ